MKKTFVLLIVLLFTVGFLFSQSDDDLFGSDDDFFGDDDFLIEEVEDVSAKTDLSKGVLFDNGSVKIGGSLSASASISTVVYQEDTEFLDNLKASTLTPSLGSSITIDARPNQDLRLFSRFNMNYPFSGSVVNVKEMFTDFNVGDYTSFRFGLHTVTWGTGLFYSPVSDMINTSSIDPEHRDEQVDGSLNLRTLINIPGTMNNLWFYVIPDKGTWQARDTALALKGEFVAGGWELGAGAFYKYNTAPRAMLTASGSIKKWALFGEAVYQYGSDREWLEKQSFDDKKSVFKATAGFMRSWDDPKISLLAQYYYDGNDFDASDLDDIFFYLDKEHPKNEDLIFEYATQGHNLGISVGLNELFGCKDLSLSFLGLTNFSKPDFIDFNSPKTVAELYAKASTMTEEEQLELLDTLKEAYKYKMIIENSPRTILSLTLNYSFNKNASMGFGPYVTLVKWDKPPIVAVKVNFTLGGGKF
ncbi:MAG: hypothetical protein J5687_09900 [Treponema sp.]|nr:hypothetical protein [Treponema sp.]